MTAGLPRFAEGASPDAIAGSDLHGQYGPYIADPGLVHAANTALGLEMPLLLTGEPGSGKSDFAWVAAHALGQEAPFRCHVRSDTRARDLLYHYDALVRFGDAQHGDRERTKDPRRYIALRPLGAALMSRGARRVVLIDEIDKAPRDLPNDLLHELDEGRFEIPEVGDYENGEAVFDRTYKDIALARLMDRPAGVRKPLVVVTSNAERQLPEPFLRRCVFFHIPPPTLEHLAAIARKRFPDREPRLMDDLALIFLALRGHADFAKPPTTAEMLNWMTAMTRLYYEGDVQGWVEAFTRGVKEGNGKLPPGAGLSWAGLPGLPCLLKLNEDLDLIGARAR
jgi:MoxR-like ATPase